MKSRIRIDNTAPICRIAIEGTIGVPEEWQFEEPEARVATYEKFRDTVRRIQSLEAAEIVVEIRSTGGDVHDALLIHDALRQTGAQITTRCYGYTASAATVIAQAASEGRREISANALYLIHTSACATEGNAAELAAQMELLRQTDARIAAIYAARSGRPAAEFESLMGENNGTGRWLSPAEAIDAGLADRLVDAPESASHPLTRNLARGWERLLACIGLRSGEPRPTATPPDEPLPGATPTAATPPDEPRPAANPPDRHPPRPEAAATGESDPRSEKTPAGDGSLLRMGEQQRALHRRAAHTAEALRGIAPTRTLPHEDPSPGDTALTTNERAYAEDARLFRRS